MPKYFDPNYRPTLEDNLADAAQTLADQAAQREQIPQTPAEQALLANSERIPNLPGSDPFLATWGDRDPRG